MTPPEPIFYFPNVVTIACGALTWLLGVFLVKKIGILSRYNFPAPVVGGLIIAVVFQVMYSQGIGPPKFDTELINSLIIAFFASLGFGASFRLLREGGRDVIKYLIACTVLLFLQACLGVLVAHLMGYHQLLGVMASIVSLAGGPGTALAFAPSFEHAGLKDAATIGLAAAMGGVLLGGIFGGPLTTILIKRHNLVSTAKRVAVNPEEIEDRSEWISPSVLSTELLWQNAYLLIVGSLGWYLSKGLMAAGIKLPFYIGAMVVAAFMRNIDDVTGIFKINLKVIDAIGSTCLTLFIATMMMTLELWTIAAVAAVLVAILFAQSVFILIAAYTVMFRVAGKDYDAAVMSGGMVGFMLGTTATALAAMSAVTEKNGPAPRAFLVVPIVGACFIDFVNALVISLSLNLFS